MIVLTEIESIEMKENPRAPQSVIQGDTTDLDETDLDLTVLKKILAEKVDGEALHQSTVLAEILAIKKAEVVDATKKKKLKLQKLA
jgi:hypothetical protein